MRYRKDLLFKAQNYTGDIARKAQDQLEAVDKILSGNPGPLVREAQR